MRTLLASVASLVLSATTAWAHPGHLTEVAGHSHWLGAAALGAAIAVGLWQAVKARKDAETIGDGSSDEAEAEPQDA